MVRNVVPIARHEGIRQMRGLCETETYEEAWGYTSEKGYEEIGCRERIDSEGNPVLQLDMSYTNKLVRSHKSLEVLHFHPHKKNKPNAAVAKTTPDVGRRDEFIPSHYDLATAIGLSRAHNKHHPDGSFKFSICTTRGMVTIQYGSKGAEFYEKNDPRYGILDSLARRTKAELHTSSVATNENIKRACKHMSDEKLTVSFTAH